MSVSYKDSIFYNNSHMYYYFDESFSSWLTILNILIGHSIDIIGDMYIINYTVIYFFLSFALW